MEGGLCAQKGLKWLVVLKWLVRLVVLLRRFVGKSVRP